MKASIKGIKLIQSFEKCRLKAYPDGRGIWTIGWGSTKYADGRRVKPGDVITQQQADELFVATLPIYEKVVDTLAPNVKNQDVYDAMVSFSYNTGGKYKDHNGKAVEYDVWHLIRDNYAPKIIAAKLRVTATTGGGIKMAGLVRRRNSEATLIESGKLIEG